MERQDGSDPHCDNHASQYDLVHTKVSSSYVVPRHQMPQHIDTELNNEYTSCKSVHIYVRTFLQDARSEQQERQDAEGGRGKNKML